MLPFDASAPDRLRDLLSAVAMYAVGGEKLLRQQRGQSAGAIALLEQLGLTGKPVAVEVNLQLVPRQRHAEHVLADNDRLEIVTLVGGG